MSGPARTLPAALGALAGRLGPLARRAQPLGSRTTYRVGGAAALLAEPVDEAELATVAAAAAGSGVPVLVLGRGSNLLVSDAGFEGLVVALGSGFAGIELDGDVVRSGAAVSLPQLARRTAAAGRRGLEWAVGVPGSVGGAIRMNAGGHGSDTAATLIGCRLYDLESGSAEEWSPGRLDFGYRRSSLRSTDVVVGGAFRLQPGDPGAAKAAIDDIVRWRRTHQPGGANAGSVFTNPPGDSAGRLIEASGLKGHRLGSAEVSTKHANFVQADPGGSAEDVYRLIGHVRRVVAEDTGVSLRTEVRMVGFTEALPGER